MEADRPGGLRRTVCPICEALCGLRLTVEGGRVTSLAGDPADPHSRGHLCSKAFDLVALHHGADRLRRPLRRRPEGGWEEIGFEEALAWAGERLRALRRRWGRRALGLYRGNATAHHYDALIWSEILGRRLGSPHRYSTNSVDTLPHMAAAEALLGDPLALPIPDLDRTELFLVVGANPVISHGSVGAMPRIRRQIGALKQRGGELVVVDPRRTATARLATTHYAVRPGTDAWWLSSLLKVILDEGLVRPPAGCVRPADADRLRDRLKRFDLDEAAARCGVPRRETEALARRFAASTRAVLYGRVGVCTQPFGGLCAWLILVLALLTDKIGRPGCLVFPQPVVDLVHPRWMRFVRAWTGPGRPSSVRGLPRFMGELPAVALADEILEAAPRERLRGLIVVGANPVASLPEAARTRAALDALDLLICVDPYLTATSRRAHLILPPPSPLERPRYDLFYRAFALRTVARFDPPVVEPPEDAWSEGKILAGLAVELTSPDHLLGRWRRAFEGALYGWLTPDRIVEALCRSGAWGRALGRRSLAGRGAEGRLIDLGEATIPLSRRLRTLGGRVRLDRGGFEEQLDRLADAPDAMSGDLLLVGARRRRHHNSWIPRPGQKAVSRPAALVHPDDGLRLGLVPGGTALLVTEAGSLRLPVQLTPDVAPGTICVPHGDEGEANVNRLTSAGRVEPVTGTALFSGIEVRVRPAPSWAPDPETGPDRRSARPPGLG